MGQFSQVSFFCKKSEIFILETARVKYTDEEVRSNMSGGHSTDAGKGGGHGPAGGHGGGKSVEDRISELIGDKTTDSIIKAWETVLDPSYQTDFIEEIEDAFKDVYTSTVSKHKLKAEKEREIHDKEALMDIFMDYMEGVLSVKNPAVLRNIKKAMASKTKKEDKYREMAFHFDKIMPTVTTTEEGQKIQEHYMQSVIESLILGTEQKGKKVKAKDVLGALRGAYKGQPAGEYALMQGKVRAHVDTLPHGAYHDNVEHRLEKAGMEIIDYSAHLKKDVGALGQLGLAITKGPEYLTPEHGVRKAEHKGAEVVNLDDYRHQKRKKDLLRHAA